MSSAPVSASVTSTSVSNPSSDLDKCLNSLQDEWSTRFARIEALLSMKPEMDAVFSPVKAPVLKAKSPVASISKMPFFYPSLSGQSGLDQAPEYQQDLQMKSPLSNLYGEPEPLFSSTSGAPASFDRDDISEGELVTGSDTELPPDQDNFQTEDQSYRETVRGVRSDMGWDYPRP